MNNIYRFPQHDQRYAEASIWIAKLDNELSAAEQETLQEWLAADSRNQAVLLRMTELWDDMTVLSRLSDLFPNPTISSTSPRKFQLATATATAAGIVIAVLAGGWTAIEFNPETGPDAHQAMHETVPDIVFATAIGEQSTVHLQDGSQVVLNTDSLIRVNYTDAYRLLRLEHGEIHVRVTKDNARPFSVIVGDKIVKAIGTAFSLEITSDQRIELIVTEGKVVVGVHRNPQGVTAHVAPDVQESSSVTVVAGEQMILGVDEEEITEVSPEEKETLTGNVILQDVQYCMGENSGSIV